MSTLYRIGAWLVVALVFAAAVGVKAYIAGVEHQDARDRVAAAKQYQAAVQVQQNLAAHGQLLADELNQANARSDAAFASAHQEVHFVTAHLSPVAGTLTPLPAPLLTRGTVCLYNLAYTGAVSGDGATGGIDAARACASADAQSAAGFDEADWLDSDLTNAQLCRATGAQLDALIGWERERIASESHGHH